MVIFYLLTSPTDPHARGYDMPPGKDDQIPRSMALALGIDDGRNPKRKRDGGGEDTGERTKRRKGSGDGTEDPKSVSGSDG